MSRLSLLASLSLFGLGCGPLGDLGHTREPAIVRSSLTISGEDMLLDYSADAAEWSSDPTATCESAEESAREKEGLGALRFAMAANQSDPIALGVSFSLTSSYLYRRVGLHAQGVDWKPSESCNVQLIANDFDDRSFTFRLENCTFSAEGKEDLAVRGEIHASRCYDENALSVQRTKEELGTLVESSIELAQMIAEDPVGFTRAIVMLPLFLAGGH